MLFGLKSAKAWAALIGSGITLFLGPEAAIAVGLNEQTVQSLGVLATTVVTWLVPNAS